MALTERTRSYETLIRHNADGTIGAHHVQITEILRDAEVISSALGGALPLAVADGQNGLQLSAVLGEALAAALVQIETLVAQQAEGCETIATLQAQLQALMVQQQVVSTEA